MSCMKLFYFGIWTNSSANYFLLLENSQTWFHTWPTIGALFDSESRNSSKENLKHRFHIVDEHLLEITFLLAQVFIFLLFPHLKYDTLVNIPISNMRIEILITEISELKQNLP